MVFIRVSAVKAAAKKSGRRTSKEFIQALDRHVDLLISRAAEQHNGGKKTLDAATLAVARGSVK